MSQNNLSKKHISRLSSNLLGNNLPCLLGETNPFSPKQNIIYSYIYEMQKKKQNSYHSVKQPDYARMPMLPRTHRMIKISVGFESIYYTPGIYADGYIVFAFPFVRSYVRSFVRSFVSSFLRS